MPFKIFTIPFDKSNKCFLEEEINRFCINKKIKCYKMEFFADENSHYWTYSIEYENILKGKEISPEPQSSFSEDEKVLFQKLKEWRKIQSEANGVPAFVVFSNSMLTDLVKKKPKTS